MQYYLVERQDGGCDYTIGCGIRISKLSATTKEDAMEEAAKNIGNAWQSGNEMAIDSAQLLEVSEYLDLAEYLDINKAELEALKRIKNEEDQRKKDEAELERLKRKLGK